MVIVGQLCRIGWCSIIKGWCYIFILFVLVDAPSPRGGESQGYGHGGGRGGRMVVEEACLVAEVVDLASRPSMRPSAHACFFFMHV